MIRLRSTIFFTLLDVSMFIPISNLSLLIIFCFFDIKRNTNKKLMVIVRFIQRKKRKRSDKQFRMDLHLIISDRRIAIHILRIVCRMRFCWHLILEICRKRHLLVSMFLMVSISKAVYQRKSN